MTAKDIITDTSLTIEQKVNALAKLGENTIEPLPRSKKLQQYYDAGIYCELFEGNAPFKPRYITPDYHKFMEQGSEFLGLQPPTDLIEAINSLLILYKHVPSITNFPVYLGNIDTLLDPFITDEDLARKLIKMFLLQIDRTITDSFCHANIGPLETTAGNIILDVIQELDNPTPNLTLKVSNNTNEDFLKRAIASSLEVVKPALANDVMFREEFKGEYAIASCYNGLKVGGGGYTLTRLRLNRIATQVDSIAEFYTLLDDVIQENLVQMDKRIKYIVEDAKFFETNFLAIEGLIDREKFTGMFGLVGLAECVNELCDERFGHSDKANNLGVEILEHMQEKVAAHEGYYCSFFDNKYLLHAQVGIDTDYDCSAGCRIPIGDEIEINEHLMQVGLYHRFFPTGIGDIFVFDKTYKKNLPALVDLMQGAFDNGSRYLTFHSSDSDLIKVTGYLVKKSEVDKLSKGESVLRDTTVLGKGANEGTHVFERLVRK
ncbi:YjjI family glycine radical enzyme [Candidatus Xianfuyuplasma coldseepsis]|uniref:YjjI family glycine radical enzyme n=1 Tax=Candidatus Xianfuyuplasma coldseepsis TaxID=2782163 RepID=A0A7L7KU29_9MOLU|nr:YjjI family glycine radical enzyme [Xianfuyuplasma coldseepsis]QMS85812.1 YjjI family glycine radical enzyme [Xianfuyuplasma coldseepsis]